jgi:hypothetical protein
MYCTHGPEGFPSGHQIDLLDIMDAYRRLFQTDLYERTRRETRHNYRKLLLELFGNQHHDPTKDAKALRKAMKGWGGSTASLPSSLAGACAHRSSRARLLAGACTGTKESVLNKIIGSRTSAQRQAIAEEYKKMYNRDLIKGGPVLRPSAAGERLRFLPHRRPRCLCRST